MNSEDQIELEMKDNIELNQVQLMKFLFPRIYQQYINFYKNINSYITPEYSKHIYLKNHFF